MPIGLFAATAGAAYLLGSIPSGFLMARARGIDIRKVGSGNIGATNAFRVLGKPAGTLVLVADGLKGYAACTWMLLLIYSLFSVNPGAEEQFWLRITAGVCAILGHNFTCWLRFKGGKGIATTAGVLAALVPWSLVVALTVWVLLTAATRYVSVGSLGAAAVLAPASWFSTHSITLTVVTGLMGALAIYKHRGNIQRLRAGTENRLGAPKPAPVPAPGATNAQEEISR